MKEKAEGVNDKCFCGTEVICRLKPGTEKYPEKLQWQNHDGSAHFNFDFKTNTTTCNAEKTEEEDSQQQQSFGISTSTITLASLNDRLSTIEGILQSILHIVSEQKSQQNKETDGFLE